MIIAVDFDGTLAEHKYPEIGKDTGGIPWLLQAQEEFGAQIILWTIRSDEPLANAIAWCKEQGLTFWGANINPGQHEWSNSNKVYAHLYIDDAALGAPLLYPPKRRPYLNWNEAGPILIERLREE